MFCEPHPATDILALYVLYSPVFMHCHLGHAWTVEGRQNAIMHISAFQRLHLFSSQQTAANGIEFTLLRPLLVHGTWFMHANKKSQASPHVGPTGKVAALKLKWCGLRKMIHVWTHPYLSWNLLLIIHSNHLLSVGSSSVELSSVESTSVELLSVGSLSVDCLELIVNK